MAGSVILPQHMERNKGKGVYYQQRGKKKNRPRLVPSSWMLSLHLRSNYASLLCRFECIRTLTCCIMHYHVLLVSVIVGYGLDELGLIPSRRSNCSLHHYVDCSSG
jgi:hypothetical protein